MSETSTTVAVGSGNPLEQFVLLAKNARGAAAVELVKQALEAPGIYVFGELLDMASIQELEGSPTSAPYFHLLQLFAFGTYKDFLNSEANSLPELSGLMLRKLRMLSVVTLAESDKLIPYSKLQSELGLESVRDVEDLIIEGISCNIMNGKMDQKNSWFEVEYVMGRDIKQSDFGGIVTVLSNWCDTCDSVLSSIETQVEKLNQDKADKKKKQEKLEAKIEEHKLSLKSQNPSLGEGDDPDSRMDAERMERREKKGKSKSMRTGSKGGFWPK